jgi:hypothetical protein
VRDGEARSRLGLVLARVQLVFQGTVIQLVDEVVRARAQLYEEAIVSRRATVVFPRLLGTIVLLAVCRSSNGKLESRTGNENGGDGHHIE